MGIYDVFEGGSQPFDKAAWIAKKNEEKQAAYELADSTADRMKTDGDAFRSYLDVQGRFDRYSVTNAILVAAQKPDAVQLKDYKKWREDGVTVDKDATKITILEPGNEYTRHDGTRTMGFNAKTLYDVSETSAKEAPVNVPRRPMKTCGSFAELKKPEHAVKLFVRFAIAKGVVTYGLELMMALFKIVQGLISTIMNASGLGTADQTVLPAEMVTAIEDCGFFESVPLWAVTLIGSLVITVLSFIMIMSVYGRFFKLYLYTALAPVPLSTFAGEPTQNVGKSFIKSYAAVCLEGAVIILACVVFSLFASAPPEINPDAAPVSMVWSYIAELIFNMLILVGAVKMADKIVHEMLGV